MHKYIAFFFALAYTANVYGEDSRDEVPDMDMEIMQSSTVIPKDMFEMVPFIAEANQDSDDTIMVYNTQRNDTKDQDRRERDTRDRKTAKQEAPEAAATFGLDFRPWGRDDSAASMDEKMDSAQSQYHTKAKRDGKQKASKTSTTTASTTLFESSGKTHHRGSHKKDKHAVEKDSSCKQVAIKVPATCYKDETFDIPYPCQKDIVKTECKMVDIQLPSTCQKTEYVDEDYPCQKSRQVCRDVVRQCERVEYKDEEYVCAAPVCKPVKRQVPSTCTRKVKVKKAVDCPPPKKCKRMKMIDQSYPCGTRAVCTDEIIPDAVCHRNVQVDEEYECLKHSSPLMQHFHKTKHHKGHDRAETKDDEADDIVRKENCSEVTIQVSSECTKSVVEKKPYSCLKTEEKQVCKNVTVRVPGICTKSVQVDELYDCAEPTSESSVETGRVCQEDSESSDRESSSDSTSSDHMRKNRQLKHSKKSPCKRACKVRKVTKEEPYKCEKTQVVKECNTVPTQVQSTCFEEKTVEKQYACKIPKSVEQCERVYTRCTRKKTVSEPYTCEKKERVCKDVPKTCFKKVPFEYEEDCDFKHKSDDAAARDMDAPIDGSQVSAQQSRSLKTKSHARAPEKCTETVEQDETYECKKTAQVEECSKEKLCKRKVAVPVVGECSERECSDVMESRTCSRKSAVTRDYDCMKTEKIEKCEDKTHKVLSSCVKSITKPKPYMCTETQYQTICTSAKK